MQSFAFTKNSLANFNGKIEIVPVCANTVCKTCSRAESVPKGRNCIPCPMCGPNGKTCPLYKCSSCMPWHIFDSEGCPVCKSCFKSPENCAEPTCGRCSEKRVPVLGNGSHGCTECRAKSNVFGCPNILCMALNCNYGYIYPVTEDCCIGCAKCQPFASSECKNIQCDSAATNCPEGSQQVEQYDTNGCQLCPTCRRNCPVFKCALPTCDTCSELFTPVDAAGCNGCPRCGVKPNLSVLPLCTYVKLRDRQCERSFAFVATDSQGCCRVSANECQISPACPNVYCKPLSCESGLAPVEQFDANGCKLCPVCE